jgi:quinol monooxygenase YgiN
VALEVSEVRVMIVRVWRCKCKLGKLEGFESFIRSELFPTLKRNDGCLRATVAKDLSRRQPRVLIVTTWKDLDSLMSFTGPHWKKSIVNPKAAAFISGKPELEHFELLDEK